jgi:cytochrome c oxidase subunit II
MSLKRTGLATALLALIAGWPCAALAAPENWKLDFQPAASPVMEQIEDFHRLLLYIIVAICLFVLVLLLWILVRYNQRTNPTPSKVHHNTVLEVVWTVVPVIILVLIAIPSFRLLYFESDIPKPDVFIRAIGHQWNWSYAFPKDGGFEFTSNSLSSPESDEPAIKAHEPRLLGVDNPIEVPVNKVVEIETTGADVIHSWALPQMGVKMDAIPGRLNHTWFKATKVGTFYGECSELCGVRHAFMPIEVKVVSEPDYQAWLAATKKKYASIDSDGATRLAAK